MLRILIADGHPIVRNALKQTIREAIIEAVIDEATNGLEALAMVRQQDWDVLVLNLSLPELPGLKVLEELRPSTPHLLALVMGEHSEPEIAMRVLKAGAVGYIKIDTALDEIVPALQTITLGERYLSPAIKEELSSGSVKPKTLYE